MNKFIFNQVMKPGDWIRLAILVAVFVICWVWVVKIYSVSLSYDEYVNRTLVEAKDAS